MGQDKQPAAPGCCLCCNSAQLKPCQCPGWQQMAFVMSQWWAEVSQPPALRLLPQQAWMGCVAAPWLC